MKRTPLKRRLNPKRKMWKRPKPLITIYDDGRQVLRGYAWKIRKLEVWERDKGRCVSCGKYITDACFAEIHHKRSRGMMGCYRDDRMENLQTLCPVCHRKRSPI